MSPGAAPTSPTYSSPQIFRTRFVGTAVKPGMLVTFAIPAPGDDTGEAAMLACTAGSCAKAAVPRTSRFLLVGVKVSINEGHPAGNSRPVIGSITRNAKESRGPAG